MSDHGQVSRQRTPRQTEVADTSIESTLQRVLDELCVVLGFCLGPDENARLRSNPPPGVDAFVDEVIRAEGMDPTYLDNDLRRRMREIVAAGAGRVL
jgi:hypothetical protein